MSDNKKKKVYQKRSKQIDPLLPALCQFVTWNLILLAILASSLRCGVENAGQSTKLLSGSMVRRPACTGLVDQQVFQKRLMCAHH